MPKRKQHHLVTLAIVALAFAASALKLAVLVLAAFLVGVLATIHSYGLDLPSPVARLAAEVCAEYAPPPPVQEASAPREPLIGKVFTDRLVEP